MCFCLSSNLSTAVPQTTTFTFNTDSLRETGRSVLDSDASPWASIYMPMDQSRNRIQLRNQMGELRAEADRVEMAREEMDDLLAPAESLLQEALQSTPRPEGLALFLTPDRDEPTVLHLPFTPPLCARLDAQVHVRPLWHGIEPDGRFYVLSLWGGGAKLHRGSRHHFDLVPAMGSTDSLDAVLRSDKQIQEALDWRTQSPDDTSPADRRPVLYRGQDDIRLKGHVREGLLRFFRLMDDRLRSFFGEEPTAVPLILAGPTALRQVYREANSYPHLLDDGIEDPVRMGGPAVLHHRAWALVRPRFDRDRTSALDAFHANTDRTATTPESVLLAAREGRIDTLFVAEAPVVWGAFNESDHTVDVHAQRAPGDIDLLNAATAETLQNGGTVYVTDATDIPSEASIAALLRF